MLNNQKSNTRNCTSLALALKIALLIFLMVPMLLSAQSTSEKPKKEKKVGLIALPVIFRTPETRWAFGGAAQVTWRFKGQEGARPSFVRPGFVYTQNKQILLYIPYRMFWGRNTGGLSKWTSFGEVGYFKYNFFFYGIGNDQPVDFVERYDYEFPRLRFNLLRLVRSNTYMGATLAYDDIDIVGVDPAGQLVDGTITGSQGGRYTQLGWMTIFDSRDNIFFPSKGEYIVSELAASNKLVASDFEFIRYTIDASKYIPINWNKVRYGYDPYTSESSPTKINLRHTLAVQFYAQSNWGDPPFDQLARLGGANRMRGFYEGRFRDKHLWLTQMEYRAFLAWRIGVSAHAAFGMVAPTISQYSFANGRFTYGGGMRFAIDKKEKINFRLDYGRGKYGSNFYVTVGEAF